MTSMQRKAYNVILQHAWYELRKNKGQEEFNIPISKLKAKAGIKTNSNKLLKDELVNLVCAGVLARVGFIDGVIHIRLTKETTQSLLNNDYYAILNMSKVSQLQGKHAVALYELAIKHKNRIPEMTVQELREYTGTTEKKGYDNFNGFEKSVLKAATEEIKEKTDLIISYSKITEGKKVVSIKFYVAKKVKKVKSDDEIMKEIISRMGIRDLVNTIIESKPLAKDLKWLGIENVKKAAEKILEIACFSDRIFMFSVSEIRAETGITENLDKILDILVSFRVLDFLMKKKNVYCAEVEPGLYTKIQIHAVEVSKTITREVTE